MRKLRLVALSLLTLLLTSRTVADDVSQIISEWSSVDYAPLTETIPVGEAFQIKSENVSLESQDVRWTELCTFHCADREHWRLDSQQRFPNDGSFCRHRDLWFVAANTRGEYSFDRVGFDLETVQSIEASVLSRANPVFASTHVMEWPAERFVEQEGISFEILSKQANPQSEKGVFWDLIPRAGSKILKAHGILEWRSINNAPRITYLRYAFGKPPSPGVTARSGFEWTLDYDLQAGGSIPKRVVWLDRKSRTTSDISRLSTAETDLNYYSPMAFGLERPRSPWPKWVYLLAAALTFAGVAVAVRHHRSQNS